MTPKWDLEGSGGVGLPYFGGRASTQSLPTGSHPSTKVATSFRGTTLVDGKVDGKMAAKMAAAADRNQPCFGPFGERTAPFRVLLI